MYIRDELLSDFFVVGVVVVVARAVCVVVAVIGF